MEGITLEFDLSRWAEMYVSGCGLAKSSLKSERPREAGY